MRMTSPIHKLGDFDVKFVCPEYPELERGFAPAAILDNFHFQIRAYIDSRGLARISVRDVLSGLAEDASDVDLWAKVRRPGITGMKPTSPSCGAFEVEIRAWRLTKPYLLEVGIKDKKIVQELAGVSVFRDGFRILPYGEFGNDWLELNKRRVNQPTERFSTNQIIGLVSVTSESNPELFDQANRLGLQQNTAFRDMRDLVLATVDELEQMTLMRERARRDAERKALLESIDGSRRKSKPWGSSWWRA